MMDAKETALGDKSVELSTLDRYKGRKGQTDRIVLVSKSLLRGKSHYFNNRTFRCLTEDIQKPGICCEKLGGPTQKFGAVVFKYLVDHEGNLIDETKCQGTLMIWLLTESKYQELSGVNKQWPLMDTGFGKPQHDLLVACTEEQYQKMTLTPCPKAHWKTKEGWYNALTARVNQAKDRVVMSLGKRLTENEVKEILGMTVATAPPTQGAGDIDLSDVVEAGGVPAGVPIPANSIPQPQAVIPPTQSEASTDIALD